MVGGGRGKIWPKFSWNIRTPRLARSRGAGGALLSRTHHALTHRRGFYAVEHKAVARSGSVRQSRDVTTSPRSDYERCHYTRVCLENKSTANNRVCAIDKCYLLLLLLLLLCADTVSQNVSCETPVLCVCDCVFDEIKSFMCVCSIQLDWLTRHKQNTRWHTWTFYSSHKKCGNIF